MRGGKGKGFVRLVFVLFGLLMVTAWLQQLALEQSLSSKMRAALTATAGSNDGLAPDSTIELVPTGQVVAAQEMRSLLERSGLGRKDSYLLWTFRGLEGATATAMGTDKEHYFVNSFLEGYRPFQVDHPWMPLYAIAMRLQYQPDNQQFSGLQDIWQTSRQAFINTRGDCEDHAILLADWLIGCGFKARVVVGRNARGGHAWVVAFMDGQEFLLEATSKRKRRQWSHYPLASLVEGYEPTIMFDRDFFWMNTAPPGSRSYTGDHWEKRSRFYSGNETGS